MDARVFAREKELFRFEKTAEEQNDIIVDVIRLFLRCTARFLKIYKSIEKSLDLHILEYSGSCVGTRFVNFPSKGGNETERDDPMMRFEESRIKMQDDAFLEWRAATFLRESLPESRYRIAFKNWREFANAT